MPFDQRSLIHREAWFPPCFVRQNQPKKNNSFCLAILDNFQLNVQIWDHIHPLLFPKDSESLKFLDIRLWEVGSKRSLNGTLKVNTQKTDGQTDISTYRKHRPRGPILWKNHFICDHDHTLPYPPPLFFENCDRLRIFFLALFFGLIG